MDDDVRAELEGIKMTLADHEERITQTEHKLDNDYKAITTLTTTMDEMKAEFKKSMDEVNLRDIQMIQTMKKLTTWMKISIVVACAALTYTVFKSGTAAAAMNTILAALKMLGII